jgi:hypothetical protein
MRERDVIDDEQIGTIRALRIRPHQLFHSDVLVRPVAHEVHVGHKAVSRVGCLDVRAQRKPASLIREIRAQYEGVFRGRKRLYVSSPEDEVSVLSIRRSGTSQMIATSTYSAKATQGATKATGIAAK